MHSRSLQEHFLSLLSCLSARVSQGICMHTKYILDDHGATLHTFSTWILDIIWPIFLLSGKHCESSQAKPAPDIKGIKWKPIGRLVTAEQKNRCTISLTLDRTED